MINLVACVVFGGIALIGLVFFIMGVKGNNPHWVVGAIMLLASLGFLIYLGISLSL